MQKYRIPVWWSVGGVVEIKANNVEQAIEIAKNTTPAGVKDSCYIDESFTVDAEGARDTYEN